MENDDADWLMVSSRPALVGHEQPVAFRRSAPPDLTETDWAALDALSGLARILEDRQSMADYTPRQIVDMFDERCAAARPVLRKWPEAARSIADCLPHLPFVDAADTERRIGVGLSMLRGLAIRESPVYRYQLLPRLGGSRRAPEQNGTADYLSALVFYTKRWLPADSDLRKAVKKTAVRLGCQPDLIRPQGLFGRPSLRAPSMPHRPETPPPPVPSRKPPEAAEPASDSDESDAYYSLYSDDGTFPADNAWPAPRRNPGLLSDLREAGAVWSNRFETATSILSQWVSGNGHLNGTTVGEAFRPIVAGSLRRMTGREPSLGRLEMRWDDSHRHLNLVAHDVRLPSTPESRHPDLLRVRRAVVKIDAGATALNLGRPVFRGVSLNGTVINLEMADGRPNWLLQAEPSDGPLPVMPIVMHDNRITWRGAGPHITTISLPEIRGELDQHATLSAHGLWAADGANGTLTVRAGPLDAGPPPFTATLQGELDGVMPGLRLNEVRVSHIPGGTLELRADGVVQNVPWRLRGDVTDPRDLSTGGPLRVNLNGSFGNDPVTLQGQIPQSLLALLSSNPGAVNPG